MKDKIYCRVRDKVLDQVRWQAWLQVGPFARWDLWQLQISGEISGQVWDQVWRQLKGEINDGR